MITPMPRARRRAGWATESALVLTCACVVACGGGRRATDARDAPTGTADGSTDGPLDAAGDALEDGAATPDTILQADTVAAADAIDASGGGDTADTAAGPSDVEAYCRQFAVRFCGSQLLCTPQIARSTESDCVSQIETVCLETAQRWQIPALREARLVFDPAAAADCLAGSDRGPCGLQWVTADPCRRVFVPRVADGGACLEDGECLGGICDRRQSCPGKCASPGKPGDDCSRYPCDAAVAVCLAGTSQPPRCAAKLRGAACRPYTDDCAAADYCRSGDGLLCENSSMQGQCTCAARGDAGSACKFEDECAPGLGCAAGQCRARTSQQGEPCSYAQGVGCAAGLACLITDGRRSALSGTCGPMRPAGSACYWIECERGLDCVGGSIDETAPKQGICTAKGRPGEPCRSFGCALGYQCEGGMCVARPGAGQSCVAIGGGQGFCFGPGITCNRFTGGVCTPPPAVGQSCWEACDGQGYCDHNATNTCLRKQDPGQRCLRAEQCASGSCSLGVCAPPCTAAQL
jgi:hypothetical protein